MRIPAQWRHRRWAYVRTGAGVLAAIALICAAILLLPDRGAPAHDQPVVLLPVISTAPPPATGPPSPTG
ncbi:hypothetical protein [Nocardia wallacei]|uniref:hypothetical protein n=1 Tax=Nocardia wallacei TaxID=480035 RepID=UPI0024590F79|nr:hypothetical protein [Nocardia wallacei]